MRVKPCPFCGNDYIATDSTYYSTKHFRCFCGKCWAEGATGDTKEEAIEKWNKRPSVEKALREAIDWAYTNGKCDGALGQDVELDTLCEFFKAKFMEKQE